MLTENVHFKTRILDLFDTFIRKQPSSPLILETVLPLLRLVRRTGDEAILATKTAGIIRSRFDKPREVPQVDVEQAKAILDEIHTFARRVSSNEVSGAASSCSLYVARCIHSSDAASTAVNDVYKATIDDWMTRNASAVRVPFLTDYIKRFAVQAWPLRAELLRHLDADTHPYRQTQIYDILAIFCSYLGTITPAVGAPDIEAFVVDARGTVVRTLRLAAAGGVADKKAWKANWLKEVLKFALHLARVSKADAALGRERAVEVWDTAELGRLLEQVQEGETRDMKGVHALIKQLRAVVEAEQGKKRKQQGE
jgi:DNA polymerase phi